MAYLNFSEIPGPIATGGRQGASAATLDARDWSVVSLARRDSLASLSAPGRLARLRARLFGTRTDLPLADPKLEVLRRVAVHAWRHGFAVPQAEVQAFVAAGYDVAQLELLVTTVERQR